MAVTEAQKKQMRQWRLNHPDYHRKWMEAKRKGLVRPRVYRKLDLDWSDRAQRRIYEKGRGRYKGVRILGVVVYL